MARTKPALPRTVKDGSDTLGNYQRASNPPKTDHAQVQPIGGAGQAADGITANPDTDEVPSKEVPLSRTPAAKAKIEGGDDEMEHASARRPASEERLAEVEVGDSSASEEIVVATQSVKEPTSKKPAPRATKKNPTKQPTVKNGRIIKKIPVKQPDKRNVRKHRPVDWIALGYESVPDDSENDEEKKKTKDGIAKLRETVNRHAKWCPFVKVNKKARAVHKRIKALEAAVFDVEEDEEDEEEEEAADEAAQEAEDNEEEEVGGADELSASNDEDNPDDDGNDNSQRPSVVLKLPCKKNPNTKQPREIFPNIKEPSVYDHSATTGVIRDGEKRSTSAVKGGKKRGASAIEEAPVETTKGKKKRQGA